MADEMNEKTARAIRDLFSAASMAHRWVSNMKIVPGGERERLRDTLNHALAEADPVRIIAEGVLSNGRTAGHDDCG